jgi:hypothetical protein
MLPPEDGPGEGFGLDLKDDNRFCAEDLRRIVGRGISGEPMAKDNPELLKLDIVTIELYRQPRGYDGSDNNSKQVAHVQSFTILPSSA